MSSFVYCEKIDEIKKAIEDILPALFERYVKNNNNPVINYLSLDQIDSYRLYMILLQNIRNPIDFHLFYRWIGIDSDWAINSPYKQLEASEFWWMCYKTKRVTDVLIKLLNDYKSLCS